MSSIHVQKYFFVVKRHSRSTYVTECQIRALIELPVHLLKVKGTEKEMMPLWNA